MENINKSKKITYTLLITFTLLIIAFILPFRSCQNENEINNSQLVESKNIHNSISKKSLITNENNDYYTYLYFDYNYNVYISADIYYSYVVNELNGLLLEIETNLDLEYTSIDSDLTWTYSYTFNFEPIIDNTVFINLKDVTSIIFEYNLVQNSQNYNYISPLCYITLSYLDSEGIEHSIEFSDSVDLVYSIVLENGYQWSITYNRGFTIYDSTFEIFSELYEVYYNLGLNFGIEIGRGYGYEEGYEIGFDDGEQKQIEKYEESGSIFENIWSFLEVGISTVLSVFSLEILPGIPLSICIIIPLVFGIIFFIWKGGAQ